MGAKAKFMATLVKKATLFMQLPEESKAKMMEMRGNPDFKEKAIAQHKEFFEKADENKDGMLSLDEYREYTRLWREHMKSKGIMGGPQSLRSRGSHPRGF